MSYLNSYVVVLITVITLTCGSLIVISVLMFKVQSTNVKLYFSLAVTESVSYVRVHYGSLTVNGR